MACLVTLTELRLVMEQELIFYFSTSRFRIYGKYGKGTNFLLFYLSVPYIYGQYGKLDRCFCSLRFLIFRQYIDQYIKFYKYL